ncbi:universal stress protein [Rhizobium sp. BK251]|uniref:universal stress protein n=1 Tax=Rhizobium sp. BK251 TaxID=2512125 RepID=UPI001049F7A8|nr:universal stress protein [Rhizobium sp. BK251]TCL69679.1 universal stress protein family protein [Rhizobium sp. BK251]
MPFKTILSIIGVDQGADDIRSAIELCRPGDAHLSVLVVSLAAPPPIGAYGAALSTGWLEERERDIAKVEEQAAKVKVLLEPQGISFDVQSLYTEFGWADSRIGERARYADLVLIGGRTLANEYLAARALSGALFESPTPVLATPKGQAATLQPRRVIVAWDSRDEAGHAIRAAMQFLNKAESVHIVMVDPDASPRVHGEEPGADIATYLARHGANAIVEVMASGGRAVDEVLRRHASDIGADMIVMGAYSHSRLRERIFGGVTRSMLEEARLPLFLAR